MEQPPLEKEISRAEQTQETESIQTIPSYGFLSFFARECLPYEGHSLSIIQRAEDLDEPSEKIVDALEVIHRMGALEYTRDGDEVTIVRKNSNNVTPGAYYKIFPLSNPVNPAEVHAPIDPLFDQSV